MSAPRLATAALCLGLFLAPLPSLAQGGKARPPRPDSKPQKIPVHVSLRAVLSDSRQCAAAHGTCRNCKEEGLLTADFDAEVESDNGILWRNTVEGRSRVKYLHRNFCPVDGEGDRTDGSGNAPLLPWADIPKHGMSTEDVGYIPLMMDRPPGGLSYGHHHLEKHHQPSREAMQADARAMMAARSLPDGGVDRELALQTRFRKTGHEARNDPRGFVGVGVFVNVTKEKVRIGNSKAPFVEQANHLG